MRRLLVLTVLLLAGCDGKPAAAPSAAPSASPSGSAAAASAAPASGDCSSSYAFNTRTDLTVEDLNPVDCAARHLTETFHTGTFTGTLPAKPPAGAELQGAYAECERKAVDFLGADWHDGRLSLLVLPPTAAQWSAGTRTFRCDLVELRGVHAEALPRTGTLKDALRGTRPVALSCGTVQFNTDKTPRQMVPAECDQEHNAEYVGTFRAPAGTTAAGGDKAFLDGCQRAAAAYVNQPLADLTKRQGSGITWWRVSQSDWAAGERSARCVVIFHQPVMKSLHNLGSAPI